MAGPYDRPTGEREWKGVGCAECSLRTSCTPGNRRTIVLHPEFERLRDQMRDRMKQPDAATRYSRRIATIEPVFSHIQDAMGFRRVSSRLARGAREVAVAHSWSRYAEAFESEALRQATDGEGPLR